MITAEEGVISALLMDSEQYPLIADRLKPDMFADSLMSMLYVEFAKAYEEERIVDINTIIPYVCNRNHLERFPIESKLLQIMADGDVLSSVQLKSYAAAVIEDYRYRTYQSILSDAQKTGTTTEELETLINKLQELQDSGVNREGMTVDELVRVCSPNYFTPNKPQRIEYGIKQIDDIVCGTDPGDVTLLGARPGIGKTALALQMCRSIGKRGWKVGYFNLEMKDSQIYERMLAPTSGIKMNRIREAQQFTVGEKEKFSKANADLSELENITIYSGNWTVAKVKAECRKRRFDVVIIDYLQLLKMDDHYADRYTEVATISAELKRMAMDLNMPVIALSQLNRGTEKTATKEPVLSDLREAGNLEQDASVVILLWPLEDDESGNNVGCKIAKNRQGMLGQMKLRFDGSIMTFTEGEKDNGERERKSWNVKRDGYKEKSHDHFQ